MLIKHTKVSTVPDSGNTSLIQPSDWNATHYVDDVQISDIIGLQAALDGKANIDDIIPGANGLSAYEVALSEGFVGTETEWLETLIGPAGASAYEVALSEGFVGTQAEWLESLEADAITVTPLDANRVFSNDGTNAYWTDVAHTLTGFVDSVEASLETITVDQGDML